jgi:hypothetical protein
MDNPSAAVVGPIFTSEDDQYPRPVLVLRGEKESKK